MFRLKDTIDKFKINMPLVEELGNSSLRARHWQGIFSLLGAEYEAGTSFSISLLQEYEIDRHMEAVARIGAAASKENSLEKALEKMEGDWQGLEFRVMPYKDTGTYILGGVDEVQLLLDDQAVKIQSMRASPFIKPFEERASEWDGMLSTLQEMLDNWLTCQSTWQYLEPIFGSEDIIKQLPEEGGKFQTVDGLWRGVMDRTVRAPSALAVARDRRRCAPSPSPSSPSAPAAHAGTEAWGAAAARGCVDAALTPRAGGWGRRLEELIEANELLDAIQKGLASYLELKRVAFPRFFFLSNDEMLEILSETKDPTKVQPHLKKCFEGVNALDFQGRDATIVAIISEEKERVPLVAPIKPAKAKGAVEKWLLEVESGMVESVHAACTNGVTSYSTLPREAWVLQHPGQVVLVVTAIFWTKDVTEGLRAEKAGKAGSLRGVSEKCTSQLQALVGMVRGNLTKLDRATLSALVVMDVHARDTVEQMANDGIVNETDFSWLSQLRMYYEACAPARRPHWLHRLPACLNPSCPPCSSPAGGRCGPAPAPAPALRAAASAGRWHRCCAPRARAARVGLRPRLSAAAAGGHRAGAHDECLRGVRLRVPGQQQPTGDHAADRPLLPHAHRRDPPEHGRRAGGPCRHGQDGDHQGSGEGARPPVRGVQLQRQPGLHHDGQVLQGLGLLRRLGLLR